MIKCIKNLFIFLFVWFCFLWSSVLAVSYDEAWQTIGLVGLTSYPSSINSNYSIWMLKWWWLLSSYLWVSKSVIAFDKSRLFWRSSNWYPYAYLKSNVWAGDIEWFFDRYYSCDLMTWEDLNNCTYTMIDYSWSTDEFDKQVFITFFDTVDQWENFYLSTQDQRYVWATWSYSRNFIRVCWNSEEIWKTFCFMGWRCGWWHSNCNTFWNLVNSQHLKEQFSGWFDYWLLAQSWISYAPWQAWYGGGWNIEWSSNTSINVSMTWNLLYNNSCTNWYVVSEVSRWYWWINNICYAWTYNTWLINDWVAYVPVETWLSYRDVYKLYNEWSYWYYSNYSDWFNSWADTMKRYKLWRVQFDIFNWQPFYLYAYFNKLYESAWIDWSVSRESYDVVNICNLALYSDYNEPYKWSYFSDVCSSFNSSSDSPVVTTWEIWTIDDEEIIPPWFDVSPGQNTSSWMIVSVDWSWTLSWNTNQNFDWKNFINDFYQKLQSVFQKPINTATWIIPWYILVFLVAIILFRFIQH